MTDKVIEQVADRFTGDTAKHAMTVLHDDGLYRHLRFKKPGSSMYWFDLVTWPGCLAITGDMNSYTFSRVEDMFTFFRGEYINPAYWGEKLIAHCGTTHYSEDTFRRRVTEEIADREDDFPGLGAAIKEQILDPHTADWNVTDEHEARVALNEFSYSIPGTPEEGFRFTDVWEWDFQEWDYRFVWCLNAIAWGIGQYDARSTA